MKPIAAPTPVPREAPARATTGARPSADAFDEALARAGVALVDPQAGASRAVAAFAENGTGNLHDTMLALEKADISLKFLVSVRNRLLETYREVMRMGM